MGPYDPVLIAFGAIGSMGFLIGMLCAFKVGVLEGRMKQLELHLSRIKEWEK